MGWHLPGGGITVLNATVDEGGEGSRSFLDGIGLLGDGELLHQLIEHLGALGVLGRHYD